MSSQLEQLLGYLERDGVTEILFGSGRPIAMRKAGALSNITGRALSPEQLSTLLRGSGLEELVPAADGEGPIGEISIGRRKASAQIARRGHEIVVSLKRMPGARTQPIAPITQPIAPITQPMAPISPSAPRFSKPIAPPTPEPTLGGPDSMSIDDLSLDLGAPITAPVSAPAAPPRAPVPLEGFSLGALDGDNFDLELGPALDGASGAPAKRPPEPSTFDVDLSTVPPRKPPEAMSFEVDLGTVSPKPAAPPPNDAFVRLKQDDSFAKPKTAAFARPSSEPFARPQPAPAPAAVVPVAAPAATLSHSTSDPAETTPFGVLVQIAREQGASDLHIAAARATSIRLNGELIPLEANTAPATAGAVESLLLPLLDDRQRETMRTQGYVDLALDMSGGGRLRANISRQQQGLKGTFRLALAQPVPLEQLGLPGELAKVVAHHQGLVVIAGPSGQGKTTTLAALVDLVNSTKPYHILTIEDPVEIVHSRKQAVISQRESGRHTTSFARGLKASLREDPDVIVIGELRDRESVEIALTAAETGHLVIATMSTPSAAKTIDRLIDMFPPDEQSQVRASVAGALRAIVAQRLLPKRGGGIVPVIELVTGVLPLAVLIRDDKLYQLPSLMQRGKAFGMIRFDESLAEHVRAGRLDEDVALEAAESKKDLTATLRGNPQAATQQVPKAGVTGAIFGFGKKDKA